MVGQHDKNLRKERKIKFNKPDFTKKLVTKYVCVKYKLDNKISVDYINVILSTESTDDICYKALVRMLKSDIFGLSL